jgi:hypothetical protein
VRRTDKTDDLSAQERVEMRVQFPAVLGAIFAGAYLSACATPNKLDPNDLKDGSIVDSVVTERPTQEPKDGLMAPLEN